MTRSFWIFALLSLVGIAIFSTASTSGMPPPASNSDAAANGQPKLHIPDMAYYQGLHQNERVSPRWFADHFTMTQQGGDDSYAVKFIKAGGLYAMQYADANFIPYCTWPAPYTCKGPIGSDVHDESGWLHAADGTRLHVVAYGTRPQGTWQEVLNPASPAVRAAFRAYTARFRGNAIFVDDTSGDIDPTPPGERDFNQYKFGAPPVEYCGSNGDCRRGEDNYARDTLGLLESSTLPVFINGGADEIALAMMHRSSKIAGATLEGCYHRSDDERTWLTQQRFIESVTAMHRYALCLNRPTDNDAADRAYDLASFWVVQDGTYAVLWNLFPRTGGDVGLMPEFGVVPTQPLDRGKSLSERAMGFGVYSREYARCSQDGHWIGPCAAVVNVSSLPILFPKLHQQYGHVMDFSDGGSWYDGATAHWVDGVPRFIGPRSGVVLR